MTRDLDSPDITRHPLLTQYFLLALEEDLPHGDITSNLVVPKTKAGQATIIAREKLVVCGLHAIPTLCKVANSKLKIKFLVQEGTHIKPNTPLLTISGSLIEILSLERTMLNFIQHLSSIATHVRRICQAAPSTLHLLDTRKTTPACRQIEKYAVAVGGGSNHRASLSDMILIKDNHIAANGGDIVKTLKKAFAGRPKNCPIEIEVQSIEQLKKILPLAPDVIMLDNFNDKEIATALALIKKHNVTSHIEVSGGITPKRLSKLHKLGIKFVSMGLLTAPTHKVDINMDIS